MFLILIPVLMFIWALRYLNYRCIPIYYHESFWKINMWAFRDGFCWVGIICFICHGVRFFTS